MPVVLRRIVEAATELVDACHGRLDVLDASLTQVVESVTVGMSDTDAEAIADRFEGPGVLARLRGEMGPVRLTEHSAPYGPPASFLGVPIRVADTVVGHLYLTDKRGGAAFTEADEDQLVGLAAVAGLVIDHAAWRERARSAAVAREETVSALFDAVVRRLFSAGLLLAGAARLSQRAEAVDRIQRGIKEIDAVVLDIRSAALDLHLGADRGSRR